MTARHILSIDQGTTSTRAIVFDEQGVPVGTSQREHKQIFDAPGWVSHDASEIWTNTVAVIDDAVRRSGIDPATIAGVGITNQRETTVVWNKRTGEPVDHAIVWQDTRTQEIIDGIADGDTQRFADLTGLPLATYFAASKVRWILDQHPEIRSDVESGDVVFGTIDSWLLWNLTGGVDGGVHATDVTNASRTLLMDVRSLKWADEALAAFDIPRSMLPEIKPSSGHFGTVAIDCSVTGVAICGILGDQQAAVFGQTAFNPGDTKNTYGTGNFVLVNTGTEPVRSSHGLITTLAYQIEGEPATYAVEGSIAVTGSLVQWLRDNLGIIRSSGEVEELALSVDDCGDVYFVPAFSGLFAPYWRPDARGIIVGLTRFVNRGHIARAALEATAFQTADVLRAVEADTGVAITELRVDGGMVLNNTLMQFQADILNVPVIRPAIAETTALGAAYAAGLAVGVWESLDQLRALWREDHRWTPDMQESDRAHALARWAKAIDHSLGWVS